MKRVAENYSEVFQDMYMDSETQIRKPAGTSNTFKVTVRVHQGSALSLFNFIFVIENLTNKARKVAPECMML